MSHPIKLSVLALCALLLLAALPASAQAPAPGASAGMHPGSDKGGDNGAADTPAASHPTGPAQSAVAAHAAFGTVPAASPAVKGALDAKDLAGAAKRTGKTGAFQGVVSKVYSPRSHGFAVLDFAPDYKDALTAHLQADHFAKFPALKSLTGKRVLITGTFRAGEDGAEIALTEPEQVKVIQ